MAAKIPPYKRLLSGYVENEKTGCWEWSRSKYKNGYGWLKVFGKVVSAHRYSYEIHKGYIPENMEIMHSCDNRGCINPDHLSVGSHAENMRQAVERGGIRWGKNHPMYGKKVKKPRQANKVMVLGVCYESQSEAERTLGLGSGTVGYWIKNIPEKAKIIELGELNRE